MAAQSPHNANWVLGNNNWGAIGTILTFDQDTFSLDTLEIQLGIAAANISFSDENGDLLFYANGCTIFNIDFDTLDQAGQLNPGLHEDIWCDRGGVATQEQYVLPSAQHPDQYFFFYNYDDIIVEPPVSNIPTNVSTKFGYAIIDMSENDGLGKVIEKSLPVLEDSLAHTGLQVVKHANGIDWWIIVAKAGSNTYYKYLFENDKLTPFGSQNLGPAWPYYDKGQSAISLDGQLYIRYCANFGISIFEFDRCYGHFTHHQFINFPIPHTILGGMALSPNKRFLYVTNRSEIFQLDLKADDIVASAVLLDTYDGRFNPGISDFLRSAMGNDGKIYWCSWDSRDIHVIHHPDEPGYDCGFEPWAFELPSVVNRGLPNIIHYELGEAPEYCDFSPTTEVEGDLDIKIFPNPNTGTFYLENIPPGSSIQMMNSLGQIVYQEGSTSDNLSIRIPKAGIYFLAVSNDKKVLFIEKVVIAKI